MKDIKDITVAVLGAGNIGKAVASGIGAAIGNVRLWNRSASRLEGLEIEGVALYTTDIVKAVGGADMVAVCVEGDAVEAVIDLFGDALKATPEMVVVSCAAAPTLNELSTWVRPYNGTPHVARLLPNVAALAGCSTSLYCSSGLDADADNAVCRLFEGIGSVYRVPESKFGPAMAISSCGIANVFRYVRAAMEAGVELGLPAALARDLASGSLAGADAMLRSTGKHPEELVDSVTTPGGLTIRGINTMEAQGFSASVIAGIKAAVKKL